MLRKEGGRGFASIDDCIDTLIPGVEEYIKKIKETLIKAARNSNGNIRSIRKTTITTIKQKWEEKQLYGYFKQQTADISQGMIWTWLRKGEKWRN